jgi:hypothetical protein
VHAGAEDLRRVLDVLLVTDDMDGDVDVVGVGHG